MFVYLIHSRLIVDIVLFDDFVCFTQGMNIIELKGLDHHTDGLHTSDKPVSNSCAIKLVPRLLQDELKDMEGIEILLDHK